MTRNAGKTWTNVTANIPDLPPWGTIYTVEPSKFNAGTAYITVDFHQENNRDPYVYKTSDFGKSWTSLSATIPKSTLSYAHCIKEDPVRPGLLFLGTENGLYVSFDDGGNWQPLQNNLPHVPVYGITVQEHFSDLVLATYGRGFWILDDITPLRETSAEVLSISVHLFPPRPAYRFRGVAPPAAPAYDPVDGQNPAYGADINYYLKSVPAGDVRIAIADDKGQVVRTLRGTKDAGVNRVMWDLKYSPAGDIRLRTSPIYAPWDAPGPDGRAAGGRLVLLAPPGNYTVKLSAGGQEFTQTLKVLKDPHSTGTEADIRAQFTFMQAIRDNLTSVGEMINQLETVRKQLQDVANTQASVKNEAQTLEHTLTVLEENLYQLRLTGGQDGMRSPAELAQKLTHLAGEVQDSDFPPTAQQLAVNQQFTDQIRTWRAQLDQLLTKDVAAFNATLSGRSLPNIVVPRAR